MKQHRVITMLLTTLPAAALVVATCTPTINIPDVKCSSIGVSIPNASWQLTSPLQTRYTTCCNLNMLCPGSEWESNPGVRFTRCWYGYENAAGQVCFDDQHNYDSYFYPTQCCAMPPPDP